MALKLEKILESMDSFKLNSEVALLENEGLTDLTRAQTRKELHESFNFIKTELIKGGLLEEAQTLLANTWTQAIMEDIYVPGLGDGEESDFSKNIKTIKNGISDLGNKLITPSESNPNDSDFSKNLNQTRNDLIGMGKAHLPVHSSNDFESMRSSQQGLANNVKDLYDQNESMSKTLNGTGAKIGSNLDISMANNPLATSAGLIGAGAAAGYGTYKAGEKVKRVLTGR